MSKIIEDHAVNGPKVIGPTVCGPTVCGPTVNGPTDGEMINSVHSSLTRRGVKSFRINSSDPSVEARRPVTTQTVSQQQHSIERASNSYKPPTNKKKEPAATDASRSPGTLLSAFGYITSPARYIGSLFTGKKEPMVVKSAPTLNKEKVKPINSKKLKEPLTEIMPDADKKHATDMSPTPTMLSASNTTVGNNSNLIKKSESKTDGKKTVSVAKRSMSQNSKYAHKLKTSPITLKEKKGTSPGQAAPEVKFITASSIQITTASQGAFRVSSKNKEEPPPLKTKKDVRKTSPERKTKTIPQTLTTPTPSAKKQHLINTLIEKLDKPEETNGPTVLTCLQPSFLPTDTPIGPTSKYPPKLKKMIGGSRNYERTEEAVPRQLANKCTPDFSNVDFEPTPTVLTPTCLETDNNFVDPSENVALVSLSGNSLVNTPSLSNINGYEKAKKSSDVENFPTLLIPTILHSPNNSKSHSPKRMTSPESKPIQEKEPDAINQKPEKTRKSASPNYKPVSFSPSRNVNGNFQPLSPNDPNKASGSDAQDNAVATVSTPAQRGAAHAYRVISPNRLPINFQDYGKHKYRSTSRSPTRSTMPYPQGRSMNSYTERYNALKNKQKGLNRTRSPFSNGNRQNMKGKGLPDVDNPVIIVMPSKKFKELAEEHKQVDPVPERIVVTQRGSYKVTTRPSDTTVAKKPSNSTLTLGEVSTSSNVIGPESVHSTKETLENQPLISRNSSPMKEQINEVDTRPPPPPCKDGIMLKSDKPPQVPSLSSKVTDKNFVQETVRRLKTSVKNKEVDYFNSLDHYGGSPAQHAAASTMLGEFP